MRHAVQFIPIATTILALSFCVVLFYRWRERGGGASALVRRGRIDVRSRHDHRIVDDRVRLERRGVSRVVALLALSGSLRARP